MTINRAEEIQAERAKAPVVVSPEEQARREPLAAPPPTTTLAIGDATSNVYQWKCTKGHVSAAIGMMFSAALLGGDPSKATLRDKRYCYVCLTEALEKLGVAEVERVER